MKLRTALPLLALALPACPPAVRPTEDVRPAEASMQDLVAPDSPPFDAQPEAAVEAAPEAAVEAGPEAAADAADVVQPDVPPRPTWCSVGADVPGLTVPSGFCIREFATLLPTAVTAGLNPRTMVFAPNGDLFVASPSTGAPGGAGNGQGAILVLSDDNRDGRADMLAHFADGIALQSVHGLALGGGNLYFTTDHAVWSTPYRAGLRTEDSAMRQNLNVDSATFTSGRWTHGLARSQGGRLFASKGEHTATCVMNPIGVVFNVGGTGALTNVADGFRNPMYLRCHWRDEVCMASELGEDNAGPASRERLVAIDTTPRHFGYPSCYRADAPAGCGTAASCASPGITRENFWFEIATTPFGFDWEREQWPAPYRGGVFVALHGSFYSAWAGAGVVYVPTDPTTHLPTGDPFQMFVQGFGNPATRAERPSDVAFSPDGRLFFSVDIGHRIYWIAPTTLQMP